MNCPATKGLQMTYKVKFFSTLHIPPFFKFTNSGSPPNYLLLEFNDFIKHSQCETTNYKVHKYHYTNISTDKYIFHNG